MALFNKTKFDDITFENNQKYKSQPTAKPQPNASASANSTPAARASSTSSSAAGAGYGIQEAIELIRRLPNVNTDIVITVVIKTLESANISVDKIIKDAQAREHKIEDRSGRLISKIESLEAEIAELNEEITHLNTDLEETNRVRELLLRSINIEPQAAPQKPANSSETSSPAASTSTAKESASTD
jgi:hypothetical protein